MFILPSNLYETRTCSKADQSGRQNYFQGHTPEQANFTEAVGTVMVSELAQN